MLSFDNNDIALLRQKLGEESPIVILSHINADGDAVGSLLGVRQLISSHSNTPTYCILPNGCPENFRFLPGSEHILSADNEREHCRQLIAYAPLIVCVDMNNAARVDFLADDINDAKGYKVLIDHHHNPDRDLFDLIFSFPELSSACELVYWLFRSLWGNEAFDRDSATCLYSGICTDTGSFAYSNDQPSLYMAASNLVAFDIDPADIHNQLLNNFSIARMQFFGYAITNCLKIFEDKHFAYFSLPLDIQRQFGVIPADMEGLVNYTLMMRDITVGVLIREEESRCKVSLRSKYSFDVNIFAQRYLNGGGHTKAAGATSTLSLEQTAQLIEQKLIEELS